jgi:riboflavin synthase
MFTGIIQAVGEIAALEPKGGDLRLRVRTGKLDLGDVRLGDSIAVSGVCLTAVELPGDGFWADVSGETLAHTVIGELKPGARVNLEKALLPTTRLGGHLVSGHVDGVGEVIERKRDARSERFRIRAPGELARYIAHKGSICVDGVSLTVNAVDGQCVRSEHRPAHAGRDHARRVPAGSQGEPGSGPDRPLSGAPAARRRRRGEREGITLDFLRAHGFARE